MKNGLDKIKLTSYDDLFGSDTMEQKGKSVIEIHISDLHEFPDHPFRFEMDAEMQELVESVKRYGVLEPILVRQREQGGYVIISGHKRAAACKEIGQNVIPAVVTDCNDDEATILMVDSNIYRRNILPSQKAKAYQMKYEALKHQGTSLPQDTTLRPVGTKLRSDSILAEEVNESARQIQRYIRLTNLVPELLEMVDNAECGLSPSIAFRPAVELSYLMEDEQRDLVDFIDDEEATPSLAQAIKMKKLSQDGNLDIETIHEIMEEQKANQITKFKIPEEKLMKVIPKNIDRSNVEDFVIKACEYYSKHLRQRDMGGR